MRTGDVVWRHDTPHGKMASSPAVWGTTLVVHGMDGHVWVLRRSDGRLLWHYTVGSPIESSPVVIGKGIDVFGAWNGTVTALDLRTHRVRWRRCFGCKITSSAAYADSTIYLGDYCGRLLALRAANGALRWSRSVNGRVYGTPAVSAGRVFVPSSTGGSLTAFSTRGRAPLVARRPARTSTRRPRSRTGACSSARTTASSTRCSREQRPHAVDAPDRRPDLRRGGRRRRRRLRRARSRTGSSASTQRRAGSCSTSRTVSTCRSPAAASACSCTATRASSPSRRDEAVRSSPARRCSCSRRAARCSPGTCT